MVVSFLSSSHPNHSRLDLDLGLASLLPEAGRRAEEGMVTALNTVKEAGAAVMSLLPVRRTRTRPRVENSDDWMPITSPYK